MELMTIYQRVGDISGMNYQQAITMREFILENRFKNILELGFNHGLSTCYMAGVLDELGTGKIVTIDLESAHNANPNLVTLLSELRLEKYVTAYYEPTSYVWRLMKMLEKGPQPQFDFCYIDGAHDWFIDGLAFFLVDKLLQSGGWIIFDDFDWTYETSFSLRNSDRVKNMPSDEKTTPQVRKVFELLVEQHPAYRDFMVRDNWGYAHKVASELSTNMTEIRRETVYLPKYVGLGSILFAIAEKIRSGRKL